MVMFYSLFLYSNWDKKINQVVHFYWQVRYPVLNGGVTLLWVQFLRTTHLLLMCIMHKYVQKEIYIIFSTNMPGNTKERSRCWSERARRDVSIEKFRGGRGEGCILLNWPMYSRENLVEDQFLNGKPVKLSKNGSDMIFLFCISLQFILYMRTVLHCAFVYRYKWQEFGCPKVTLCCWKDVKANY